MNHELYIFGSVARGEVTRWSDVDLLVIPLGTQRRESYPASWSVYSPDVIEYYYQVGRLFAWHLHLEAKCIFSIDNSTFLSKLGVPEAYTTVEADIDDLVDILNSAIAELKRNTSSPIFEIGLVHTAIRDIAMSASWMLTGKPLFSVYSPFMLPVPPPLSIDTYKSTLLARHCSTRGAHADIDQESTREQILSAPLLDWVSTIKSKLR